MSFTAILEGGPLHGEIREISDPTLRVVVRTNSGIIERRYELAHETQDASICRVINGNVYKIMFYRGDDEITWKTLRQLEAMMGACDTSISRDHIIKLCLEQAHGEIHDRLIKPD